MPNYTIFFVIGIFILISGLAYRTTIKNMIDKYKGITWATITSYKTKYKDDNYLYKTLLHTVVLFFEVDDKRYTVKKTLGESKKSSSKIVIIENRLQLKKWAPSIVNSEDDFKNKQILINYNPKNPENITFDMNDTNKLKYIAHFLIYLGLFFLSAGACTFVIQIIF